MKPNDKSVKLGTQRLQVEFLAASAKSENRTIAMQWYTGAEVDRQALFGDPYKLSFSLDPGHVRMDRFQSGKAPVTNGHWASRAEDVVGVIESADASGKAVVRFSSRPDVAAIWNDVKDGILRNASMEAQVFKLRDVTGEQDSVKSFLAVDWEPLALAIVPVGADPNAGLAAEKQVLSEVQIEIGPGAQERGSMEEGITEKMDVKTQEEFKRLAGVANLSVEFAQEHINKGTAIDEYRVAIFEKMATKSGKIQTHAHHATFMRDQHDGLTERMAEALTCKVGGKAPSEGAREWMGATLVDMAAELLRMRGVRFDRFNRSRVVDLSMQGSSDFTNLLTGVGNRTLLAAYQSAEAPIKSICRPAVAKDFRAHQLIRLSESPKLLKVAEGAQITIGAYTESKESCTLASYGRGASLTRQALINDDLGAFTTATSQFGQAAANLEAQIIVDVLTTASGVGPTLETDSTVLFHTNHGNLAGAGAACDATTISTGRAAMRLQKGIDGVSLIQAAPRFLLMPATKETTGEQVISSIQAATVSNVNPFAGKLELLVEPRLDAASTTAWYLFADPSLAPVMEMLHLEGAAGPQFIRQDNVNGILGMQFYCFIDFAAAAIGFRGCWRNPGA